MLSVKLCRVDLLLLMLTSLPGYVERWMTTKDPFLRNLWLLSKLSVYEKHEMNSFSVSLPPSFHTLYLDLHIFSYVLTRVYHTTTTIP